MAKKTLSAEMAEMLASGKVTKAASNSFLAKDGKPLATRSMESLSDPLELGDIISIPTTWEVLEMKFDEAPNAEAKPFILVEVTAANGAQRNMRFFPNSLTKYVWELDPETNKSLGKRKTTGTATELYGQADTVDASLNLIRGRRIKVADVQTVFHHDRYRGEDRNTHIYRYDLV